MGYLKLMKELLSLRSNAKKSATQITKLQEKKLRALLLYAYNNSPYYRNTFEESGIDDLNIDSVPLEMFPTIDKSLLMQNFDEIVTVEDVLQKDLLLFDETNTGQQLFKDKYHIVHSSGSTGKPCYFMYDEPSWNTMLGGIVRGAFWDLSLLQILKFLKSEPRIVYIAATDGRYGGAMAVGDGVSGMRAKQMFLDIKTPLSKWKEKIANFRPNMIIGYPSAIKILGELVESGDVKTAIFRVVTCGEPLNLGMRQYFSDVFKSTIINIYGASESLALGVETNVSDGLYIFDDLNIIESDSSGMYLTSLYNYAQPLIRYRLSDRIIQKEKDIKYPFSKIDNIVGRNEDLLWFEKANGEKEFLHPLAVEGFCIDGMIDYRFIRKDARSFAIEIETTLTADKHFIQSEIIRQLGNILSEKQLDSIAFDVNFVTEIPPDPKTGKKKLIV